MLSLWRWIWWITSGRFVWVSLLILHRYCHSSLLYFAARLKWNLFYTLFLLWTAGISWTLRTFFLRFFYNYPLLLAGGNIFGLERLLYWSTYNICSNFLTENEIENAYFFDASIFDLALPGVWFLTGQSGFLAICPVKKWAQSGQCPIRFYFLGHCF